MHCEQIQIQISSANALDAQVEEHLQSCANCREFHRFSNEIVSKVSNIDIPAMSPRVYEQVKARRSKPRSKVVEFGLGLASVGLAVLVVGAMLSGGKAEAAYRQMRTQMTKVTSVHMTIYWRPGQGNVEDGALQRIYDLWWQPGAWREKASRREGGDRLQVAEGTGIKFYRYDETSKKVESSQEANMNPSDFSLEMVAKQYMDTPAKFEESPLDDKTNLIIAINKGGWSRMKFYVDSSTHLPYKADKEYQTNGTWKTSGHFDFEFNRSIPKSMFDPSDLVPRP